jgi:hypothetical protein
LVESSEKAFRILFENESALGYSEDLKKDLVKEFTKYGLKISDEDNKEFITGWLPDESGSFKLGNLYGVRYFYNEDLYKIVDDREIINENNAEFSSRNAIYDSPHLEDILPTAYDMQRQLEHFMRAEEASDKRFEEMAYGPPDNMYESSNPKSKNNKALWEEWSIARREKNDAQLEWNKTKDDFLKTNEEKDNAYNKLLVAISKWHKIRNQIDSIYPEKLESFNEALSIKFKQFINKFKEQNPSLIESIEKAFDIIFENAI